MFSQKQVTVTVMISKRALFNGVQSDWSKQHIVFLLHTKSWPRIRQLRKLHLSSLFDRLALSYWHGNFTDWYKTKGKSIFFSHTGFESRAMRFSEPKSPWSRKRSKSNSPPLSFSLHYSNRQTQNFPNRSDLPLRGTQNTKHTR